MTGRWRALVLVALLGASVAACSDDGPGEGEARLEVDGKALVERADGDRETIDDSTDLGTGDRVTVSEGVAVMRLAGGTTFELRKGLDLDPKLDGEAADTAVLMDKVPVLEAGDLLVTAPESAELEADGTQVLVREGAARITRAFGMSASAYDADLELDSAGVPSEVPALRRVAVPDLGRPRPPRPVEYEASDPWDRRYLGAAMELGDDLEVLAGRLTSDLPDNEGRAVGFFKLLLPGLDDEADFTQTLLDTLDPEREREQGDTLIGAAITDLGERGSFDDRWGAVFGFRDEGAAWGIVALDQTVQSEPLIGSVEEAFNTSADELAQGPTVNEPAGAEEPTGTDSGGSDQPVGGTGGGGGGGTDGDDGGSSTPSTPVTPPSTPPTLPPPLTPPSEPPADLDPLVEPLVDLVDDLLGGLLG